MKRIYSLLIALAVICSLSASALAAETSTPEPSGAPKSEDIKMILDEMQTNFDALSDKEKEEIYKIGDNITEQYISLVEKYADFGILSEDEATKLTEMLGERNEKMQENGRMLGGFFPPPHSPKSVEKSAD